MRVEFHEIDDYYWLLQAWDSSDPRSGRIPTESIRVGVLFKNWLSGVLKENAALKARLGEENK